MLLKALIDELGKGKSLLFRLDDDAYSTVRNSTGSVGGHFRHNLNFVNAVLNGIETGLIDYANRERDPLVEANRLYAASKIDDALTRLAGVSAGTLSKEVSVRSEIDERSWHRSTVSRELEFVQSHTVHHHALIAEKLARFGIEAGENFGVALSTLEYWKQKAA